MNGGLAYLLVDLRSAVQRQQELLVEVGRIAREEQRRLAIDIHDDAVQVISAALLRLGALRLVIRDPIHQEAIAEAETAVASSVSRRRSMMFQLSPHDLATTGLLPALQRLSEELLVGSPTTAVLRIPEVALGTDLSETLFRIIRKALLNVRKHSCAREVVVTLTAEAATVTCRVVDDGPGPLRRRDDSFGVRSIVERAQGAAGTRP